MYVQFHSVKEPSVNHDIKFGFDSDLGKIWVLVRFVLAGFGFFPSLN